MRTVREVLAALDAIAPPHAAYPWDRIGLQVGSPDALVRRALVCLDCSLGAIRHAAGRAEMVVGHHPVVWDPMPRLTGTYTTDRCVELVRAGLAFAAAHTNWDAARPGLNDALAERLGLADPVPFGGGARPAMHKLVAFVPETAAESVLDAIAAAGAGEVGAYRRCAFWSSGIGTFEPQPGARPTVGEVGKREEVAEVRLEAVLPSGAKDRVESSLLQAHPYEEPAFEFVAVEARRWPLGRIGRLGQPMTTAQLGRHVAECLETPCLVYGAQDRIDRVAVVGGAAGEMWDEATQDGAAFVTGELPHHAGLEAADRGRTVIAAGHYATEQPGVEALAARLASALPDVEFEAYVPAPGEGGRPA